jgi:hypothetical protein
MPQGTLLDIPQEEQAQMLAALRRTRYGYLLALHMLLLCTVRAYRAGTRGLTVDDQGQRQPPIRTTVLTPSLQRSLLALLKVPARASGWCRTRRSCATLALTLQAKRGIAVSAETLRCWLHKVGWVWALPFLTALCWPAEKAKLRRHKTSVDWVRQMSKQVCRWMPGRRLVLVVDGGFAAVSLALACVKHQLVMVSRLRWDAALYHPPGLQPPGKRGPKSAKGKHQRSLQGWASRSDTPWEEIEVDWYGGQRKKSTLVLCRRWPLFPAGQHSVVRKGNAHTRRAHGTGTNSIIAIHFKPK